MDIIKIIGIGLISLIMTIIIKQHRPEFAIYISVIAGVLILTLVLGKVSGIITLLSNLADKTTINRDFLYLLIKFKNNGGVKNEASKLSYSRCNRNGWKNIFKGIRRKKVSNK